MPLGCGRRDEYNLRAVQAQRSRAFREMTVIAYVNADSRVPGFKRGETEVTGCEIELLPETGKTMRDMSFAVFSQIFSVSVDHRRRVVINASHLFFVDRR